MPRSVFLVWFFIFLTWVFYRIFVSQSEAVDELIAKPLFFILPPLIVTLGIERKTLSDVGLLFSLRSFMYDVFIGVGIGTVFALEAIIVNMAKYQTLLINRLSAVDQSGGLRWFVLITLITSFSEEFLSRGYLFNRLLGEEERLMRSIMISTLFFILLHIPIFFTRLHLTGTSLFVYLGSLLLLSVTNSIIFVHRRTLTLPVLIHFFWSMTVSLYL